MSTTAVLTLAVLGVLAGCEPVRRATGSQPELSAMDGGHPAGGHAAHSAAPEGAREVSVEAASFRFVPDVLHARPGEALAVTLASSDVLHDFTIDGLEAHVAAEPGATARGGFVAAAPGRHTYYCSVPGHRELGMEGSLVVG